MKVLIDVVGERERVARLSLKCPYHGSRCELGDTRDLAGGIPDRGGDMREAHRNVVGGGFLRRHTLGGGAWLLEDIGRAIPGPWEEKGGPLLVREASGLEDLPGEQIADSVRSAQQQNQTCKARRDRLACL